MKITVIGTGYVGLVTGVSLSDVGHDVVCIDTDTAKIEQMRKGISPIYEPGLEDLMIKNIKAGRLNFTNDYADGLESTEVIMVAVGTPQNNDGTANLQYIEAVAQSIGENIKRDTVIVTKSTVPVGTNHFVKKTVLSNLKHRDVNISIASNPEFLKEGSAIQDTFYGDRIVIGTEDDETAKILEKMYEPLKLPIFKTDIYSSEMIKYASNAFLATKISFIFGLSIK